MNLSLSPLDNRYKKYTENINNYFSEYAFFYYRILVEIQYFKKLCQLNLQELSIDNIQFLDNIITR